MKDMIIGAGAGTAPVALEFYFSTGTFYLGHFTDDASREIWVCLQGHQVRALRKFINEELGEYLDGQAD